MFIPFELPLMNPGAPRPVWIGDRFQMGDHATSVLEYHQASSGWTDDLTDLQENLFGDQFFIDRASRRYAVGQLQKYKKDPLTILEIGCSSGYLLSDIRRALPGAVLMGADVVKAPLLKLANSMPGIPLFLFDLVHCPFPDNSLDEVVLLNVLEHIERDDLAVAQLKRILKPGGVAVIEVPAGPHLYDAYDKAYMHFRRYSRQGIRQLLQSQGFIIRKQSALGFFVYPGFWWTKKKNLAEGKLMDQATQLRRSHSNQLMNGIMNAELWLGQWLSYPIGIRYVVTAQKPMER